MLETTESWTNCTEKLQMGMGQPKWEKHTAVNKVEESWRSETCLDALTSDMELQNMKFAKLVVSLALVQYFITMPLFILLGMVIYILSHCILEVCGLLFDFYFIGYYT